MKRTKTILKIGIIFWVSFSLPISEFGQFPNLIVNGGFENGTPGFPNAHGQINECIPWNGFGPSTDWWGPGHRGGNSTGTPPSRNGYFVGFYSGEYEEYDHDKYKWGEVVGAPLQDNISEYSLVKVKFKYSPSRISPSICAMDVWFTDSVPDLPSLLRNYLPNIRCNFNTGANPPGRWYDFNSGWVLVKSNADYAVFSPWNEYQHGSGSGYHFMDDVSVQAAPLCSKECGPQSLAVEWFDAENVFTPNNDGINDTWSVTANHAVAYTIEVIDRWGATIYNRYGEVPNGMDDFKIEWGGELNSGQMGMDDVYNILVTLWNCEGGQFGPYLFSSITQLGTTVGPNYGPPDPNNTSWFRDDCCCGPITDISDKNMDTAIETFNYGTELPVENGRISENLKISNGATLHINRKLPLGYQNVSGSNYPLANSIFFVNVSCDGSISILEDGAVIVGDNDEFGNVYTGVLSVLPNTSIIIGEEAPQNGTSSLIVKNNSKLIVQEDGYLVIRHGAEIVLDGQNAIFEVRGKVVIEEGATLKVTGNGKILFDPSAKNFPNFETHTNSSIEFSGSTDYPIILEIPDEKEMLFQQVFHSFEMSNGIILLGENSLLNSGNANFSLENVVVDQIESGKLHNGIYLNGQLNHFINNCVFRNGNKGITAFQYFNHGAKLRVQNSEFRNCNVGLLVYDKGTVISNCEFENNGIGYKQNGASFHSQIVSSDFISNGKGVEFHTSMANLKCTYSNFNNNGWGVEFRGGGTLLGLCNSVMDNFDGGLLVADGGSLDISNVLNGPGSQSIVTGNEIGVGLSFAKNLNLSEGHNDLVPAVQGNGSGVYGFFYRPATSPTTLKSKNNHWNARGAFVEGESPLFGVDYATFNYYSTGSGYPAVAPIYLQDNNPIAPVVSCLLGNTEDPEFRFSTYEPVSECIGCRNVQTTLFQGVKLSDAILISDSLVDDTLGVEGVEDALSLLREIYMDQLPLVSDEEQEIYDIAYDQLKYLVIEAREDTTFDFSDSVGWSLGEFLGFLDDAIESDSLDTLRTNIYKMDRANLLRIMGDRTSSVAELVVLQGQNSGINVLPELEFQNCLYQNEELFLSGQISFHEFELLVDLCSSSQKNRNPFLGLEKALADYLQSGKVEFWNLNAYPNPSDGRIILEFELRETALVKIVVQNSYGETVGSHSGTYEYGPGLVKVPMDLGDYAKGLYLISVESGDERKVVKVVKH